MNKYNFNKCMENIYVKNTKVIEKKETPNGDG